MSKRIDIQARPTKKANADQWVDASRKSVRSRDVKFKRMTFDLHPDVHRQLRLHCLEREIQMSDLLRGLIDDELKKE